jgi:hypothetical protein
MKYHVTNTDNPIDFPVTKFVHIVYVHPVENGLPNLYKVKFEKEFETETQATDYVLMYNKNIKFMKKGNNLPDYDLRAVYYGCVNDETGEPV